MAGKIRAAVVAVSLLCGSAAAQVVDPSLQALLGALMQGTEVALLTPLTDGTIQVTSFRAPGQRSAAEAAALIERARTNLRNLGVAEPTGQQLAAALAGGSIEVPAGRTAIAGVLPGGANGAQIRTQVVTQSGLPQIVGGLSGPGVAGPSAAAGGTAPSNAAVLNGPLAGLTVAQQTQALQLANSQLAALGITQPTPQQVSTMLGGGTLVTPAGASVTVPGLLSAQPAQAPLVVPASPAPATSTIR